MHRMPAEPDWAHSTSASYEKAGWNAGDTTATQQVTSIRHGLTLLVKMIYEF